MNFRIPKKELFAVALLFVLFLCLRIPAIHAPYHQDEYKWPLYSDTKLFAPGVVPHPPLTEFIYRVLAPNLGYDNFRVVPLVFSIANFFLIFMLSTIIFGKKSAFWTISLFTISFYSVLSSLMVDVDGAVMVFFFIICAIGYFKSKASSFKDWRWIAVLLVGAVGGFLVKVSGILPIVAIALDFAIDKNVFKDTRKIFKYALYTLAGVVALSLILILSKLVFPFFNLGSALKYWEHFAVFSNRGWLQTFIQFVKSILYSSPLLIIPAFCADRETFKKARVFYLFIFCGLFFYLFAFDFSIGALDRYFEFLVVPLSVIAGAVISNYVQRKDLVLQKSLIAITAILSVLIFSFQFFYQYVPYLYPKTDWIKRVLSFRWNFLFPFTGGSGPLPFYVSFAFIALLWIVGIVLCLKFLKEKSGSGKKTILICLVVVGCLYNMVFVEEYLFGEINGSAPALVESSVQFIKNNQEINNVTVYNDNGGYVVMETGKYQKRLYIDPKFDVNEKIKSLNANKDFYLVVEIPKIDPSTVYAKYFSTCKKFYHAKSGLIDSFIYDCRKVPDIKL